MDTSDDIYTDFLTDFEGDKFRLWLRAGDTYDGSFPWTNPEAGTFIDLPASSDEIENAIEIQAEKDRCDPSDISVRMGYAGGRLVGFDEMCFEVHSVTELNDLANLICANKKLDSDAIFQYTDLKGLYDMDELLNVALQADGLPVRDLQAEETYAGETYLKDQEGTIYDLDYDYNLFRIDNGYLDLNSERTPDTIDPHLYSHKELTEKIAAMVANNPETESLDEMMSAKNEEAGLRQPEESIVDIEAR